MNLNIQYNEEIKYRILVIGDDNVIIIIIVQSINIILKRWYHCNRLEKLQSQNKLLISYQISHFYGLKTYYGFNKMTYYILSFKVNVLINNIDFI